MTPPKLLATLRARGLEITAAGDRLRIQPVGQLTEADRALLTAMKPTLLVVLEEERQAEAVFITGPWQTCLGCGGHRWRHRGTQGDECVACHPVPGPEGA